MNEKTKLCIFLFPAIAETIALFWFSMLPSASFINSGGLRLGDIEHFAAYLVYGFLWAGFFVILSGIGKMKKSTLLLIAIPVIIGSAVGASCEALQLTVPSRVADPVDWIIDTIGALCGALAASKLKNLF